MTDVATKQDQAQVDIGRVPIMIEITEEDRQSAGYFTDICGCLIWTALTRMGYSDVSVDPWDVKIGPYIYSSDEIKSADLFAGKSGRTHPFYGREVVGKQIVLYPV